MWLTKHLVVAAAARIALVAMVRQAAAVRVLQRLMRVGPLTVLAVRVSLVRVMLVVWVAAPIVVLAAAVLVALVRMPQRRMLVLAVLVGRAILLELTFGMLVAAAVHSSVLLSRVRALAARQVMAAVVLALAWKTMLLSLRGTVLTVLAAVAVAAFLTRVP